MPSVNNPSPNIFTAYGDNHVCINATRYSSNLIVIKHQLITEWTHNRFDTISQDDMQQLAALDVEVILLGTGKQLRFPRPELLQSLALAKKGMEVMDIHAACRTYNMLTQEGRKVAAALLFS